MSTKYYVASFIVDICNIKQGWYILYNRQNNILYIFNLLLHMCSSNLNIFIIFSNNFI